MENQEFQITDDLLASQGQRFLNHIIDIVVVYLIIFGLGFLTAMIASMFELTWYFDWAANISGLQDYLIYFSIMIPYFTLMESISSKTVGKFITKTMVVLEDGTKPESGVILKRTFCRIIPFDGFSFLGGGRGWHDSISDTFVVNKDDFEKKRELFYAFNEIGTNQDE